MKLYLTPIAAAVAILVASIALHGRHALHDRAADKCREPAAAVACGLSDIHVEHEALALRDVVRAEVRPPKQVGQAKGFMSSRVGTPALAT